MNAGRFQGRLETSLFGFVPFTIFCNVDRFSEPLPSPSFSALPLLRFAGFPVCRLPPPVFLQRLGVPDSVSRGVPAVLRDAVAGESGGGRSESESGE